MPTRSGSQNGYVVRAWSSTAITSSTSTLPQPWPGAVGCLAPLITWPHAVCRPLEPRGLHITTTNPAAACICASSKNVSPYCVNGPPCTFSSTGYRCAASNSAGRMIQASISSDPSPHGTAKRSHPDQLRVRAVATGNVEPSCVTSSPGCSTVDCTMAIVEPAAWNVCTDSAPLLSGTGACEP